MIYLVKSINLDAPPKNSILNLKAFLNHDEAEIFMQKIAKQIPENSDCEWLEIEILTIEGL